MSSKLLEGVRLSEIVSSPSGCGAEQAVWTVTSDAYGQKCKSIVVTMEYGQMAGVPWAACELESGETVMINLAAVESVVIAKGDGQ